MARLDDGGLDLVEDVIEGVDGELVRFVGVREGHFCF